MQQPSGELCLLRAELLRRGINTNVRCIVHMSWLVDFANVRRCFTGKAEVHLFYVVNNLDPVSIQRLSFRDMGIAMLEIRRRKTVLLLTWGSFTGKTSSCWAPSVADDLLTQYAPQWLRLNIRYMGPQMCHWFNRNPLNRISRVAAVNRKPRGFETKCEYFSACRCTTCEIILKSLTPVHWLLKVLLGSRRQC